MRSAVLIFVAVAILVAIIFFSFRRYEYRNYISSAVESEKLTAHIALVGSFNHEDPYVKGSPYYLRMAVKTKPGFYFDDVNSIGM